jgi:hypothetical protein
MFSGQSLLSFHPLLCWDLHDIIFLYHYLSDQGEQDAKVKMKAISLKQTLRKLEHMVRLKLI